MSLKNVRLYVDGKSVPVRDWEFSEDEADQTLSVLPESGWGGIGMNSKATFFIEGYPLVKNMPFSGISEGRILFCNDKM